MQLLSIENETEKSAQIQKSLEPRMPQRPGFGKQGKEVLLYANYFKMMTDKNLLLFRYAIEFLPDTDGKVPVGKKAKRIVQLLLEENLDSFKAHIATDYKSTVISKSDIPLDPAGYKVVYKAEGEDAPGPRAKTTTLRLQPTGTLRMSELVDYLSSTQASTMFGSKDEVIQALNIIMGQYPKAAQQIFSVGANKHFELTPAATEKMDLGAGLSVIRGFFVSVRAATAQVLLNVNVKHVACYNSGPLTMVMNEHLRANNHNWAALGKFLKKVRVEVTHIARKDKNGNKIPRIKTIFNLAFTHDGRKQDHPPKVLEFASGPTDVSFFLKKPDDKPQASSSTSSAPTPTAKGKGKKIPAAGPEKAGGYVTVSKFFLDTYNFKTDPGLPVVNVGNTENPTYLPADVCIVVPGQPCGAKLSPGQTQQMIKFAVRRPIENERSIVTKGAQVLGIQSSSNPVLVRTLISFCRNVTNHKSEPIWNKHCAETDHGAWPCAEGS